jgi:integrase
MAVGRVTVASLKGLEGWCWDEKLVGFGARRQTRGTFFYVRFRLNGAQVVRSIGRNGPWTCDTARREAQRILGIVATGVDPFAQEKEASAERLGAVIDLYLDRKRTQIKPRTFLEVTRYLRQHAAQLHKVRLGEIDRRKVAVLLGQIETASGAVARNRARAALSAFFAWTIAEGLLDVNPVAGTAKANEGGSRERVLTAEELRQLWLGLGNDAFGDIVRLLALTGQRRNEIGGLTWSEVDLVRKQINLSASRVKNSREHSVPLSSQAFAVLARQPRRNSTDLVFSGFHWSGDKAALDRRLGLAPWRLHDLRRTCATGMAELGILPHVIEAALNHVSGHKAGVAGVYNRARYSDEMRAALQKWADHVEGLAR